MDPQKNAYRHTKEEANLFYIETICNTSVKLILTIITKIKNVYIIFTT